MLIPSDEHHYENNHLYPERGLLNDPNGLIYFKGQYHVFYQWNPHGCDHKYKEWGHFVSDDLVSWQRLPSALQPSLENLDSDGIYSGTALVKDGRLYVFYTGNVNDENGQVAKSSQMWAVSDDGIHFEKLGEMFPHPDGFTEHVRDPMVWQGKNGHYFLILGAQHLDQTGDIIVYESVDLQNWTFRGSILGDQLPEIRGYMLECPDFVQVDGKELLMFSPQGLAADKIAHRYQNIYNTGYVVGHFDEETARFTVKTAFEETDHGFEFYAPQVLVAPDGRRIMWGWAGTMPEKREALIPTIAKAGWVHLLTMPREIHLDEDNRLVQYPIRESLDHLVPLEDFDQVEPGQYVIETKTDWTIRFGRNTELKRRQDILYLERRQWDSGQTEIRQIQGNMVNLILIVDQDILEIFTADGLNAMTARYFN